MKKIVPEKSLSPTMQTFKPGIQQPFVSFVQPDALKSAKRPATSMVSNAASGSGLQSSTPELKLSNMDFPLTFESRSDPMKSKHVKDPSHLQGT